MADVKCRCVSTNTAPFVGLQSGIRPGDRRGGLPHIAGISHGQYNAALFQKNRSKGSSAFATAMAVATVHVAPDCCPCDRQDDNAVRAETFCGRTPVCAPRIRSLECSVLSPKPRSMCVAGAKLDSGEPSDIRIRILAGEFVNEDSWMVRRLRKLADVHAGSRPGSSQTGFPSSFLKNPTVPPRWPLRTVTPKPTRHQKCSAVIHPPP